MPMNNEEKTKQKEWSKPELIDLDLELTEYSGSKASDGSSPSPSS